MINSIKNFINWAGKRMILATESNQNITDLKYIETKITNWINSPTRQKQLTGERYYHGDHDILRAKRTVLGEKGELEEIHYLPNNRNIDNQYAKMVDQKKNYLLGQPISFDTDDKEYAEQLKKIFNKRVQKTLKDLGGLSIRGGIAWIYPYYSDNELKFKLFPAYEILPFWNDTAHTELNMAVRHYFVEKPYATGPNDLIQKVEIYTKNGIDFYTFENNRLVPEVAKPHENYLSVTAGDTTTPYNWERIPLIPFKRNAEEKALIEDCKNLQDAINDIISTFKNNMEEDARNTILVLENYDGQDLGEFRQKLAQYGTVKVRSGNGAHGDVRTLTVEINYENYEAILKIFKTALIENCKGYDFSEFRSGGGTPNQMNIKSIYSDIDLDANDMETEYQASFEDLLWFVNRYLKVEDKEVDVIFNRDGVVNEAEIMQMLVSAGVKISNRTLLAQVPFVDSIDEEIKQVKEEEEEALDAYGGSLPMNGNKGGFDNGKDE